MSMFLISIIFYIADALFSDFSGAPPAEFLPSSLQLCGLQLLQSYGAATGGASLTGGSVRGGGAAGGGMKKWQT